MRLLSEKMAQVAKEMLSLPHRNDAAQDKIFRSMFGAPIGVITEIWNRLEEGLDPYAQEKHLLWGLVFIKIYSTEAKTYRKWSWYFVGKVASLAE
jgi:hypothetical protein